MKGHTLEKIEMFVCKIKKQQSNHKVKYLEARVKLYKPPPKLYIMLVVCTNQTTSVLF